MGLNEIRKMNIEPIVGTLSMDWRSENCTEGLLLSLSPARWFQFSVCFVTDAKVENPYAD